MDGCIVSDVNQTKRCTECGLNKSIDRFSSNKGCRDGLSTVCKDCIAAYGRAYRRGFRKGTDRRAKTTLTPYENWLNFVARIEFKDDGCWIFKPGKIWDQYCNWHIGSNQIRVHVYSYTEIIGSIPKGLVVRHQCHVKRCVNPQHLLLGTPKQNMEDSVRDRLVAYGERSNSKLTETDVRFILSQAAIGITHRQLAEKFNVHRSTISKIVQRKNWKYLDERKPA